MRWSGELDVGGGELGELGDAQPGLDGSQEQGVVTPSEPGGGVWRGEQRVDLGVGEPGDHRSLAAVGRDGEHPLDHAGVFGVA